ncbi:MAG TPA: HepT-like ribonuclease domain-containing protein [Chthoniobacteraceae bacterium]|jgi:uncharacterized protein with HEPN domain|nr:HepT-like ribonuclease domain-containing protein [Chthoniobacteraceae bacterium]
MKERSQAWYLAEIVESAKIMQEEIKVLTEAGFLASQTARDAVCFRFIAIGHAASHITQETRDLLREIPFELMYGMRNVLAHDYTAIDYARVWRTAVEDVPEILRQIEPVLQVEWEKLKQNPAHLGRDSEETP